MKNFILSSEDGSELTAEQKKKFDISTLPMSFLLDGQEYSSKNTPLTMKEFCDKMRKGSSTKTSQPNEFEVEEYLTELLKEGKDILHISMTSRMSGTYSNFKKIAERLNENSDNKIYVVDSLCQSYGIAMLMIYLRKLTENQNLTAKEAFDLAEKIKLSIAHVFVVDDLKYLARGGRIPSYLAFIGNMLTLKPVLFVDDDGEIKQHHKVIGRKKSINDMVQYFKENFSEKFNTVCISEADCKQDAECLKAKLLELNSNLEIEINSLGPVITSHCGPNTLALFFVAKKR